MKLLLPMVIALLLAAPLAAAQERAIRIGSKNFSESAILGEIVAQLIERETALRVDRRFNLGGTNLCHQALVAGELDLYVEYTGTGLLSILELEIIRDRDQAYGVVAREYARRFDLVWLDPLGFENTYALSTRPELANEHGWEVFSDVGPLAEDLSIGVPHEFTQRPDGYPGLVEAYGFEFGSVRGLDPGLMYRAAAEAQVDIISGFSTDGRIAAYGLKVLSDDRGFFPPYDAAPVIRRATLEEFPALRDVLGQLDGAIDEQTMGRMNYAVDEQKRDPAEVARQWLETGDVVVNESTARRESVWSTAWRERQVLGKRLIEHIGLSLGGVAIAILIAVPAGILVHRSRWLRGPVLGLAEVVQTIPSLAMLAFLFVVYRKIGTAPALTALVLYALLPIVVNTYAGLSQVAPALIEAARGVGMSPMQRLRLVELPLASPVIVAGIRTATVWTVGIATLATYIGAGGLGDFIQAGLARADYRLTLIGAIPAALLALALSSGIRVIERALSRS